MKTTVDLPQELALMAGQMADQRGISLELLIVEALRSRIETFEDPLFGTYAVYEGPAPSDLSERHDNYLYSEEK